MRKLPAYKLFLIISGSHALLFTMMGFIHAIYRVEAAQLNPLQLVLLGTALEVVIFVFEVPTGIVADVYSQPRAASATHGSTWAPPSVMVCASCAGGECSCSS
jgi:hypothetical protein